MWPFSKRAAAKAADADVKANPGWALTDLDRSRLQGVHPDLVRVVESCSRMVTVPRFRVTEGVRTLERQRMLVATGASKTLHSRHLTGHAVDLAVMDGNKIDWTWARYIDLSAAMKAAANAEGVALEWGGDWKSFKDGVHFQLPFAEYPDQ